MAGIRLHGPSLSPIDYEKWKVYCEGMGVYGPGLLKEYVIRCIYPTNYRRQTDESLQIDYDVLQGRLNGWTYRELAEAYERTPSWARCRIYRSARRHLGRDWQRQI